MSNLELKFTGNTLIAAVETNYNATPNYQVLVSRL